MKLLCKVKGGGTQCSAALKPHCRTFCLGNRNFRADTLSADGKSVHNHIFELFVAAYGKFPQLVGCKRAAKSLADVWYNAIDKVFDADVPYKLLLKLPSRMYRYQKVFLKPRSLSCAVLRFACKKMDYPAYIQGFFLPDKNTPAYDVMNIEKRPFPSYTGSSLQKSENWFDLFDEAVDKCVKLIGLYCTGTLPVDPALFRVNFSGGLSE